MGRMREIAASLAIMAAMAWSATADTAQLMKLIAILKENGTITAEQYDMLVVAADTPAKQGEEADVKVETKGGISVATYDGEFSAQVGGRIHIDAAKHREDKNDLGDGTRIRRAWLELGGTLYQDWDYDLQINFADNEEIDIVDAFFTYRGLWPAAVKIGHFKEPFSMEELTGANNTTFMERALVNELVPSRNIGVSIGTNGSNWNVEGGLFGDGWNDDVNNEGDEGWGATGRAVFAPICEEGRLLHLGAALSYREPDDDAEIDFKTGPESSITDIEYLDTEGKVDAIENMVKYGIEAACMAGPFSLQSEYITVDVNREPGEEDRSFAGWYVNGSWLLTGESRKYDIGEGVFKGVVPKRDMGALELAARYSMLDLNHGNVDGGQQRSITLGLNWYINDRMRLMANYIMVDGDSDADADDDVDGGDEPDILQLRLQAAF